MPVTFDATDEVEVDEERAVTEFGPVFRADCDAAGRSLFRTLPALPLVLEGGRMAPGGGRCTPLITGLGTGTFFSKAA